MPPYQRSVGNLIRVRNQENSSSVISGRWPNTGAHTLFARFQFRVHPRLIYIQLTRSRIICIQLALSKLFSSVHFSNFYYVAFARRGKHDLLLACLLLLSFCSFENIYAKRLLSCLIINDNYTLEILMMIKEVILELFVISIYEAYLYSF